MDNAVDNAFGWCTKKKKKKKKHTNNKEEEYGSKNNGIILKGTTRIEKIKKQLRKKKETKGNKTKRKEHCERTERYTSGIIILFSFLQYLLFTSISSALLSIWSTRLTYSSA